MSKKNNCNGGANQILPTEGTPLSLQHFNQRHGHHHPSIRCSAIVWAMLGGQGRQGTTFLCCSVTQSCPTLYDPMNCSTPGFPVLHYVPDSAQTHVHWVSDAIQPFHPLSPPSSPALNLSQHQGLLQWVCFFASGGQSIGASVSVLPMNVPLPHLNCAFDWLSMFIELHSTRLSASIQTY